MINVILLEDNKAYRESYVRKLENNFNASIRLLNPHYSDGYEHIYQEVLRNLNETDLVIADIALTENINDAKTWASQLLLDVLEELGDNAPVKRRGLAVVFMTAHIQEQVQAQIQLRHPAIFNTGFIYTNFIRKGYLTQDLEIVLTDFVQNFIMSQSEGRWIMRQLLNKYMDDIASSNFLYVVQGHPTIRNNQIIAIEIEEGQAEIHYFVDNISARRTLRFDVQDIESFCKEIGVYIIKDGRKSVDNPSYNQIQEIIPAFYFFHIANRPFRIINARRTWQYMGRPNGHGKTLQFGTTNYQIECTFDIYNDWMKSEKSKPFFVKKNKNIRKKDSNSRKL